MSTTFDITKEALLADGWVTTDDPVVVARKSLPNRNPINASEDSQIELLIHNYFNTNSFGIALPDGGILNFIANSMAELKAFENAINFYDPPF